MLKGLGGKKSEKPQVRLTKSKPWPINCYDGTNTVRIEYGTGFRRVIPDSLNKLPISCPEHDFEGKGKDKPPSVILIMGLLSLCQHWTFHEICIRNKDDICIYCINTDVTQKDEGPENQRGNDCCESMIWRRLPRQELQTITIPTESSESEPMSVTRVLEWNGLWPCENPTQTHPLNRRRSRNTSDFVKLWRISGGGTSVTS